MKKLVFETFLSQNLLDQAARVTAVGLQTIPKLCSASLLLVFLNSMPGKENFAQCPM